MTLIVEVLIQGILYRFACLNYAGACELARTERAVICGMKWESA